MKAAPFIAAAELRAHLGGAVPPFLIDVMPEEEFQAAHLPGAKNACVYNITFLDDVQKLAPQHEKALIVYGSSVRNLASADAAKKLLAAGYARVTDFRGGLEEWRAAGFPCGGDPSRALREMPAAD